MHIAIAAPLAPADLAHRLSAGTTPLPAGYTGAPLVAVLIDALLAQGHRVTAITVQYGLSTDAGPVVLQGERLRVVVLPGRAHAWRFDARRPGRALDLFRHERAALVKALHAAAPDIVHAHWTYEFALAALASGRPHLVTAHDVAGKIWRYSGGPYRALRCWMARQVLRQARHLSAVSQHVARQIQPAAAVPVQVVPNPVSPNALALGRTRLRPRAAQVALVSNGFSVQKNPQPAMRAMAQLRQRCPAAELHLYGQGFEPAGEAARWAAGQGLDTALFFHGVMPHGRLLQALAEHDLLLHPSLDESFGVVVAEAMALGLAVVAGRDSGGPPEVAGTGQWLVDVRSPDAMADAMHEALATPARYAAASAAGRERVQTLFSASAVADRYVALYERALQPLETAA